MSREKSLALALHLGAIVEGIGHVLKEVGGEETCFLMYVQNEDFCGVAGNVSELNAIPVLRRMIAECEKRAVDQTPVPTDDRTTH